MPGFMLKYLGVKIKFAVLLFKFLDLLVKDDPEEES